MGLLLRIVFAACFCVAFCSLALAEPDVQLAAARLLATECPDLHSNQDDVAEVWHNLQNLLIRANAMRYADPAASLSAQLRILKAFLGSYPITVLHICPGSLMRLFKRAGDAAVAMGDLQRCRYLMQWGTTYRVMALSRWYLRLTGNPLWKKETMPPETMNFDPEYQTAYDFALDALHTELGVKPRPIPPAAASGESVEVLAVCLYANESLPNLAARNHRLYSEHHGYAYQQLREVPEGGWERLGGLPREPHYWKIQQTLDELKREGGPDWVLVVDCDAFFTNLTMGVLDVVAAYGPSAHFLVAEDPAGINTGVLLFRRSDWTRDFLQRVLETPFVQIWDQSQFFWQMLKEAHALEADQPVVLPEHIAPVHQSHLNAYHSGTAESWNAYGWQPGDYIVHYAGCPWDESFCWDKMEASARVIEEQLPAGTA